MNTLKIFGETISYEAEDLQLDNVNEITHDDAKDILFTAKKLLDEAGIDFYLGYGTLLGAIRDKDFIKGDLDVDVYFKDEKTLVKNIDNFKNKGLKLVRAVPHVLYSFRLNDRCYMDFYVWGKPSMGIWRLYCDRIALRYIPSKLLKNESTVSFLGGDFKIAGDPIALLTFWYGDTWNTPIGKFEKKYYYEVKSHYYFTKMQSPLKYLLRKIIGPKRYEALKSAIR